MKTTTMQVPSGASYNDRDLMILKLMHMVGFIRYQPQPFVLQSGAKSHIYVYGREDFTDSPRLQWHIGKKIAGIISNASLEKGKQVCLIGIPTAGVAFAQAAAMASYSNPSFHPYGQPIGFRLMKQIPKNHGAHKGWINGEPNPKQSYWLLDNVATTGNSKIIARAKMRNDGYPDPYGVLIWIDRQQGAVKRLQQEGFQNITVAYNLLDIVHAYGELGLWSKDLTRLVEEEIKAQTSA